MYSNPFGSSKFGGGGQSGSQSSAGSGGSGDLSSQIMTTVKQDMESVEKSGQWVFSCYSPAKVRKMDYIYKQVVLLQSQAQKN